MYFSGTAEGLSPKNIVGGWCVHRDVNAGGELGLAALLRNRLG